MLALAWVVPFLVMNIVLVLVIIGTGGGGFVFDVYITLAAAIIPAGAFYVMAISKGFSSGLSGVIVLFPFLVALVSLFIFVGVFMVTPYSIIGSTAILFETTIGMLSGLFTASAFYSFVEGRERS